MFFITALFAILAPSTPLQNLGREELIRLHSTLASGPMKVWRKDEDERHIDLHFAKNAGSGLIQNAPRPNGANTLTVEYHGDLSHQLADALHSSASLRKLLGEGYRISLDPVIEPHSIGSDPAPAEIALEEKQDSRDLLILRTRFPIRDFEHVGRVRFTFQTPSGKTIFGETREIKPGRSVGVVEIPLDRFREQGKYQLMEFELMENSPPGSNPAIHEGKQHRTQNVSIRGIHKTVVVQKRET